MFRELAIRGDRGALLWTKYASSDAATLTSWAIKRDLDPKRGPWVLTASARFINRILCGRRPLYFTAPRLGGGRWMWPVLDVTVDVAARRINARLGLPEQ